jgi:hypothetical protein
VAVFAGGFAFGTLLTLPNTVTNFEYVSDLLSFAFLLFATSIFVALSLQYLLRYYMPKKEAPSRVLSIVCQVHTFVMSGLIMGGFVILDIVLISIGRKAAGIVGIALICLIPVWYILVEHFDRTGQLGEPVPIQIGLETHSEERSSHVTKIGAQ